MRRKGLGPLMRGRNRDVDEGQHRTPRPEPLASSKVGVGTFLYTIQRYKEQKKARWPGFFHGSDQQRWLPSRSVPSPVLSPVHSPGGKSMKRAIKWSFSPFLPLLPLPPLPPFPPMQRVHG